jgi:hypothetical protein
MGKRKGETYEGHPCVRCGATERYVSAKACVACRIARDKAWREANPAQSKAWKLANPERCKAQDKAGKLRRNYGITPEAFDAMLKSQAYRCDACLERLDLGAKTHVDHDHATGLIRGILCHSCNLALGRVKDDPWILRSLARYLEDHRQSVAP